MIMDMVTGFKLMLSSILIILLFLHVGQGQCPTGLNPYSKANGCLQKLDCSGSAIGKTTLPPTLLEATDVKGCVSGIVGTSGLYNPKCPPTGYKSGETYVEIPNVGCTFCIKMILTRFATNYEYGTPCSGSRRKRSHFLEVFGDHNIPLEFSSISVNSFDVNITNVLAQLFHVNEQQNVSVPIEKIGPDPVNVTFTLSNADTSFTQRLEFGFGYEEMTVDIDITSDTLVVLSDPSAGILGEPSALMFFVKGESEPLDIYILVGAVVGAVVAVIMILIVLIVLIKIFCC